MHSLSRAVSMVGKVLKCVDSRTIWRSLDRRCNKMFTNLIYARIMCSMDRLLIRIMNEHFFYALFLFRAPIHPQVTSMICVSDSNSINFRKLCMALPYHAITATFQLFQPLTVLPPRGVINEIQADYTLTSL